MVHISISFLLCCGCVHPLLELTGEMRYTVPA